MSWIQYVLSLNLTPSDWVLFATVIPVGWFLIVYGFFTKFWGDPFGIIIFFGAISLAALLVLIIYGTLAGQRIDEIWRFILLTGVFLSWVGKDVILHMERHNGKIEKRRRAERPATGSVPTIH